MLGIVASISQERFRVAAIIQITERALPDCSG